MVDFCEETAPHRYLEVFSVKGGKPKESEREKEIEREHDQSEFEVVSNMKNTQALSVEEVREKLQENGNIRKSNTPTNTHGFDYTYTDKHVLSSNIINSFTENSNVINEKANNAENKQFLMSTNSPKLQVTNGPNEAFPHDESERSDIYIPHHTIAKKIISSDKATADSRDSENLPIKYPTHSSSELSISALGKQSLQEFRPQFEGGFIPLVMNPMKEKEFVNTKKIIYPPQHQRAHRPFLYNESVPFHGTFKPGVPDFSGFNISNYSQEDGSIIMAPNQENLQLLSASKPQPVHKPFPPFGALPLYLLQNPNNPPLRNQRPQNPSHRFQHYPSPLGSRKNIFPHPQLNKHNFPMPNVRDDDLVGVPSQRVYVSRQATMEKKPNFPNNPNIQGSPIYNRKPHNTPPNKIMHPPPIQRRPDVYEDKETNIPHINIPPRKFNNPHMSANVNNQHNAQKTGIPLLQSGGLQSQLNSRPQISNLKAPPKNLQDKPGPIKPPFSMTQVRPRDRIHQIPRFPNGVNLRTFPQIDEKLKHQDGLTNQPQNSGSGFPFPLHIMNQNDKTFQELKGTQMQETLSNNNRNLPHFINAELVEIPTKNIPQTMSKENQINPTPVMQNIQPNIKSQTVPNIDYGKILLSPGILPFPTQSGKPLSISKMENSAIQMSDAHEVLDQKSNNDRNQHANPKEPNSNQSQMLKESQPAVSSSDHLDKSIETSVGVDISSSKHLKLELPVFLGYESEADESDNLESVITDMDYSSYTVPFGARLKFSENGTKIPIRILNETPKNSFGMIRKPQMNFPSSRDKNSNGFVKPTESTTHVPTNSSTTVYSKTISTTTETAFIAMESSSNFVLDKQNVSFENNSFIKNLYYTPPLYSLNETFHITNSSSNMTPLADSSKEVKHIPIIADELDGFIQTSFSGRKYILPNNSDSPILPFVIPLSATEDINLPQISEYQPVHDNRTDYSILNHILALIEGPLKQKSPEVSS